MTQKLFEFSIIASGLDPTSDDFEARFFNAGCDDATVSFQNGQIFLDFARVAHSFALALSSAVEEVRGAGAQIVRIESEKLAKFGTIQ